MFLSVWRFSHLALAVITSIFVLTLAVTGVILAFEPMAHAAQDVESVNAYPELTLGQVVTAVRETHDEVLSLAVDAHGYMSVAALNESGDFSEHYVHPETGEFASEIPKQSQWMKDVTTLHRSLFFKTPGRVVVAINSLLFFLIVASGVALVVRRQQGLRNFYSRVVRDRWTGFIHLQLGRYLMWPLALIALTGVYLSLLRFDVFPSFFAEHKVDFEGVSSTLRVEAAEFPVFVNTPVSQVRSLDFPFSDDVGDFYTLRLRSRELMVNQYTGQVMSEVEYPLMTALSELATLIHTGRGSVWWSVVLAVSALSVPVFAFTGFRMTWRRRSGRIKNHVRKRDADFYVLVASETGTTFRFARDFQDRLRSAGISAFVDHMDAFAPYPEMKNLVVFAATYGQGEPPSNAVKFETKLKMTEIHRAFSFSVVGFGSRAYADFCKFAFDVDSMLAALPKSTRLMEPFAINGGSTEAYRMWLREWGRRMDISLSETKSSPQGKGHGRKSDFTVANHGAQGDTHLLALLPRGTTNLSSGDLIAVQPPDGSRERLYSAGVLNTGEILLSVKRHDLGLCSNYLGDLAVGEGLRGRVVKNRKFRFPGRAKEVVMIATGTGIAPFLGMIDNNRGKVPVHLYWGAKTVEDLTLYRNTIDALHEGGALTFEPAFSRQPGKGKYVQDLILRDAPAIAEILRNHGVVMICGSIAMQKGVTDLLDDILRRLNGQPLSHYQTKNRIRMDCY